MSYKCIEVEAMIGGYEGSSDGNAFSEKERISLLKLSL